MEHQVSLYRRIDTGLSFATLAANTRLDCKRGCSYCCHYRVMVTATEAFVLAEAVQTRLEAGQRSQVTEKLRANRAATARMTPSEHEATNIACAFLADDGTCGVYDVRPLACRKHHSAAVATCEKTFVDPSSTLPAAQLPQRLEMANGFLCAAMLAARDAGADTSFYEMSSAVLEALDNKSANKRWRDGKVAMPGVTDRTSDTGIVGFDELPPVSMLA